MIQISQKAQDLLNQQRRIYNFLAQQLKQKQNEEQQQSKDFFVPELLCKTNICQLLNQEYQNTESHEVKFNIHYADKSDLTSNLQEIGKFIGKNMTVTDENYKDFLQAMEDKINTMQQDGSNKEDEEKEFSEEEIKLAANLCTEAFVVEDINKSDDETILSTFKKLWLILLVILCGGAGIGVLVLNCPLYMQDLGATSSQVTLFQSVFSLGQLVGSPVFHIITGRFGYKLTYLVVFVIYAISALLLSICTEENTGSAKNSLTYIYLIRLVSGFAGIIQPISHSYISQVIATKYRTNSSTINNIAYYVGVLFCSITNIICGNTGIFSQQDDVKTFVNGCYVSLIYFGIGFILSIFVKEQAPEVLLRRKCRKCGVKYIKPKSQQCTFREAFKEIFTNKNLVLCFFGLIFALGTSNCNAFIAQIFVKKYMHLYNSSDAQVFLSIMSACGIGVTIIVTLTVLQYCLRKGGPIFIVIIANYSSSITSLLRSVPVPMSKAMLFISALFNQLAMCLCDAPYFSIVSTYTTPYNKAKIFGVFQTSNSIARALFTYVAGLLLDYQVRNCGWIFTYFTFVAVTIASFVKTPNAKFA